MPNAAKPTSPPYADFQQALLAWYGKVQRPLPWRDYERLSVYEIWLAEVMLQQTIVATVTGYYTKFLSAFPSITALAAAPLQEVLHHWQGLGYYRRAHMLHRCAQVVVAQHGGVFPATEAGLRALPSFGAYTAAAVAALAYQQPAVAIDGNVVRVVARLGALPDVATPQSKPIQTLAATLAAGAPPRAYTNAVMELGATLCTPRNPACNACPVQGFCAAYAQGKTATLPLRPLKKTLPQKHGVAYVLRNNRGEIWLTKRPDTGLLSSLWQVPNGGWEDATQSNIPAHTSGPEAGFITHTFTHFKLTLEVRTGQVNSIPAGQRFSPGQLPPLPTLMRKVLRAAQIAC